MEKTIAAISTGLNGGIGIIRMSGENSFEILNKIFIPKNKTDKIEGYTIKYGNIVDNKNGIIDEVLVSFFVAPKSYTTENMVEINSHGGNVVMNKILDLCIENGACLAEPGEFTKRAFLNGRIDLTQAEAVIDIINSKTDKEMLAAENQLEGNLSKNIKDIRSDILDIMADIEASIDYPEYDIEETTNNKILRFLDLIDVKLEKLENTFEEGKILREGIKAVILGRPNAGKSSLLNLILNEERAIVTDIEGTTRDSIEEYINIKGIPLKIIDTAGIRNTEDTVEKIGVEKSIHLAEEGDLLIGIFDISKNLNFEDLKILDLLKKKTSIIILNKIDLNNNSLDENILNIDKPIVYMSAKTGEGKEELFEEISKIFNLNNIEIGNEAIITNNRHKYLIKKARENVKLSKKSIEDNLPLDMISSVIREILENLGEITGESVTEDIINKIFSKFCLGK